MRKKVITGVHKNYRFLVPFNLPKMKEFILKKIKSLNLSKMFLGGFLDYNNSKPVLVVSTGSFDRI
jgi:hypothetical protein